MADTLSRSTMQSIVLENLTFKLIANEQQNDATLNKVKDDTSLQPKEQPLSFGTKTILFDVGTGYSRQYIPSSLRKS